MKKILIFTILLFITTINANSQIKGVIVDSLSSDLMQYCTVSITDSSDFLVAIAVSDNLGNYNIICNETGFYNLRINFTGYKTFNKEIKINSFPFILDTITLNPDYKEIDKITIQSKTNYYKEIADKTIVTLNEQTIKSKPNVFQSLKTIPGIEVDTKTRNISVFGNNNTLILINGIIKTSYDISELKTKDIFKIEIITNPGAKYNSEYTAVINIITKNILQKGFSATINTECYVPFIYNFTDLKLEYGFNKLKLFASYHLFLRRSSEINSIITHYNIYEIIDTTKDNGQREQINHFIKIGIDYFINQKNFFSVFTTIGYYKQKIPSSYSMALYVNNIKENSSNLNKTNNSFNIGNNYSIYFNHSFNEKSKFNIYASYNRTSLNNSLLSSGYLFNEYYYHKYDLSYMKNSFFAESNFTTVLKDYNIEIGANYYYRSVINIITDSDSVSQINYREKRPRYYTNISRKIKKTAINIGLSSDFYKSNSDVKLNFYFLPSFSVSQQISKNHFISINYARKIIYPETKQINTNYTYTTDSLTYFTNNSNLKPSLIDRLQFSYTFRKNSFFIKNYFFYEFVNNPIQYNIIHKDDNTFISQENIGYSNKYGTQTISSFVLFDERLTVSPSFSIYNNSYFNNNSLNSNWSCDISFYTDYYFDSGFDVFFSLYLESKKAIFKGYSTSSPMFDFGISKNFCKDALNILIDFTPLNDYYTKTYDIENTTIFEANTEFYRNIYFQINYNFNRGEILRSNRNNTIEKDF
ncbi:MAG: outer membrane beta-barrel protein [Bacteroidales bacterium]|nr:outer membrane beta-barrel protein [Bacteroidales bacterium]